MHLGPWHDRHVDDPDYPPFDGYVKPTYDSTSGVLLPAEMVKAAQTEELGYCDKIGIWTKQVVHAYR